MILILAVIGGLIASIPGASFLLIPIELFMLYWIASKHNAFKLGEFMGMSAAMAGISTVLKGVATGLHALPGLGQLANSGVAFAFIYIIGMLAEQYFGNKDGT